MSAVLHTTQPMFVLGILILLFKSKLINFIRMVYARNNFVFYPSLKLHIQKHNTTHEKVKSVLSNQTVSLSRPMLFTLTLITLKIKSMRVMSKLQIYIYIYM